MKKILLVDDDLVFNLLHGSVLERSGFEVATATNGEEALAVIAAFKPDLVVLDVMMPVKDGLTMLRELRAKEEAIHQPVIVVTAHLQEYETTQAEATASGASGFLTKPISPSQMLKEVRRYLDN